MKKYLEVRIVQAPGCDVELRAQTFDGTGELLRRYGEGQKVDLWDRWGVREWVRGGCRGIHYMNGATVMLMVVGEVQR